jgi:hypothetical protein
MLSFFTKGKRKKKKDKKKKKNKKNSQVWLLPEEGPWGIPFSNLGIKLWTLA